jgi:hypothetical protein
MYKKVKVSFNYINKKGIIVKTSIYIEKYLYDILYDESITEEEKVNYLIDEYQNFISEKNYKRKVYNNENTQNMAVKEIINENTDKEQYIEYFYDRKMKMLVNIITKVILL